MNKPFYKMRSQKDYECLQELVDFIGYEKDLSKMTMIEIGSYIGESTTLFARHFGQVISVDPFENNYDMTDEACHHADFEDVYEKFLENIAPFKNIEHLRLSSRVASVFLRLAKVDFVYIDGNHLYEYVTSDIKNYIPLIKSSGYIGGHDYTEWHPNVMNAVNDVLGVPDITFCDGSWLKQKH